MEQMDSETCIRCGRRVDIDSDEFGAGEAAPNGGYICEGCLTGAEEQAIAEDTMALASALEAAGLSGDGVDLEAMDEDEYEMREDLAVMLYESEPGADLDEDEE